MEIEQGEYTIKAMPLNNKSWRNAEDLEAVFILKTDT